MSEKTIRMTGLRENVGQDDGIGGLPISVNRELKQQRRRRLRERQKWIRVASNFIALIPSRLNPQMLAIFL